MAQVQRPPGPAGHFLLGNIPELTAEEGPHNFLLETAIEYPRIAHFTIGRTRHVYLISDPDLIQQILINQRSKFVKNDLDVKILSKFLGTGILTSQGDYHRRQRKMVQPVFHATRIHAYADTMVQYTERLLKKWQDNTERNIHQDMMILTMEIVAKTLFDSDVQEEGYTVGHAVEELQQISHMEYRRGMTAPEWLPLPHNLRRKSATRILNQVVMRFITERRSSNVEDRGDLLSMLLLSEDDEGIRMTDQEVRDEAVTLFAAGHETTSNALAWTWYLLAQHPEVMQKLQQELDAVLAGRSPKLEDLRNLPYTHQVLKESLRLYPPAWLLMSRRPLEDMEFGGYVVPANSMVIFGPYITQHHPLVWDDPETFDPERFTSEKEAEYHRYAYFPFGGGEHVCIGNSFAMMEAALLLATIAQRYDLKLVPDQIIEPLPQITMAPKHGLQMTVTMRQTQGHKTIPQVAQ